MAKSLICLFRERKYRCNQYIVQNFQTVIFFILVFYFLLFGFGPQYLIFVSIFTVMFKLNYKKNCTFWDLVNFCSFQFFLNVVAYIATLSISLTIGLNLLVPFYLIYTKSSQFNPKGYFINLMTFTFCQFLPIKMTFIQQSKAFLAGLLLFLIAVKFYSFVSQYYAKRTSEKNEFSFFADLLNSYGNEQEYQANLNKLAKLTQQLYFQAYLSSSSKNKITPKTRIAFNYAFLSQRALYFFTSIDKLVKPDSIIEKWMTRISDFFEKSSQFTTMSVIEKNELRIQGKILITSLEHSDEVALILLRNLLIHSLFILRLLDNDPEISNNHWSTPLHHQTKYLFQHKFRIDSFELRVALRFSIVLAFCFSLCTLTHITRGTWLPMNAFLLLQPMNEETTYRLKTRFLGTIFGCLISIYTVQLFSNNLLHLILASLLGICAFTIIPGTTFQATLSTIFALFLSSLVMSNLMAAGLRFVYVLLACSLVFLVNQFILPTGIKNQFRFNLQELFHIHQTSLIFLQNSFHHKIDYGTIADLQMNYHLLHGEIKNYFGKSDKLKQISYKEFLSISWQMITIVEQLLLLIDSK
ncbi:TPA: FUSC family protein, partial [Enterococcus faecalis]